MFNLTCFRNSGTFEAACEIWMSQNGGIWHFTAVRRGFNRRPGWSRCKWTALQWVCQFTFLCRAAVMCLHSGVKSPFLTSRGNERGASLVSARTSPHCGLSLQSWSSVTKRLSVIILLDPPWPLIRHEGCTVSHFKVLSSSLHRWLTALGKLMS